LHLFRRGWAIPKTACRHIRTALEDICNVNIFAREVHRLQNSRQQLSGASDERFPLLILICTGRFTDEHQIRVRISDTEYCLRPRAGEMRTFRASANLSANRG
jgi:hypothetical protein